MRLHPLVVALAHLGWPRALDWRTFDDVTGQTADGSVAEATDNPFPLGRMALPVIMTRTSYSLIRWMQGARLLFALRSR